MRFLILFGTLFLALNAGAETPASSLWTELKTKREKLPSLHQEFEITQTYKTATISQSSKRQIVLDMSHGQWREQSSSGSGDYVRIFDGKDLFLMEDGGDEFVRPSSPCQNLNLSTGGILADSAARCSSVRADR
jgi:hypothetical protein